MEKLKYNKAFRQGIGALLFCLLLFGGCATWAVVARIQYNSLVANMETVEATIVDITLDYNRRGPDEQEIDITYEVDGVVYKRELATDTAISFEAGLAANYSVGDKLQIYYDPQNPEIIASPRSVSVGNVFFWIGFILSALAIGCLIYLLKKRKKFLVTQEEYEKEKRAAKNADLLEKNGEKKRCQYFNIPIYAMLSFAPTVAVIVIGLELLEGDFNIRSLISETLEATPVVLVMWCIFIGPLVILSVLNRFCFGKVVCVVNENTLFIKNRDIPINNIKEIAYHPRFASRYEYCYATISVQSNNKLEAIDVNHFPLYGIRKIKKYNPNIKVKCDKYIWFYPLLPTVIVLVLLLIIGVKL